MTDSTASRNTRLEQALADRLRRRGRRLTHVDRTTAPLSYTQQSLWILSRLAEGEAVNHRPLRIRLRGELDPESLRRALEGIVRRHAVLRTTFPLDGAEPVQWIHPPSAVTLDRIDVSAAADPESAAESAAADHLARPFDLTAEPAFRPLLVRIGPTDHLLVVSFHHIVFDGWSERIFVNELVAHYDTVADPALAELEIDYADYACWERERIDEDRIAADVEYWRNRLADLPPDLELPPDRGVVPAPHRPVTVTVPQEVAAGLERLAAEQGATLFMVLLALLQILVARHSGQDDIVVGVPTAGRPLPETEPLIGCFINTVAIRADIAGNPRFVDVLGRVRHATLEALDHAAAPFGRVFGELRPWTPDRPPLYRVHFQLRNFPDARRRSQSLDLEVVDEPAGTGNHLTVRAAREDGRLTMTFAYDPARFRRDTVERWAGHYLNLLRAVVADPTSGIRDPELIDPDERRRVLVEFNRGGARRLPPPTLVADRLRERAEAEPHRVAVEDGDAVTTYAQLDGMVDRVAAALVERGLGAEDRVVVYGDRSLPTIAGIVGALRAGVAYIPVDADLTTPWLAQLTEQARPALALTRSHLAADLSHLGVPVLNLDRLVSGPAVEPVLGRATPESLAYVLYTSGSTGPPKGVMVEQRHLVWYLDALASGQPLGPGDRIAMFHSISFDAIAASLHLPVSTGATVVVRDEESLASVPRFLTWLTDRRITHLRVPTAYFHVFATEILDSGVDLPPTLRLLAIGGEQARADIVERWYRRFGEEVALHNGYGPTETTVSVTTWKADIPPGVPFDWVPIGRPHPGCAVYVLDERGRPTPIGVVGEIHVGGPLVSRGYLDAPDLTEQRFGPDPFAPGGRMYRTGDLGRWLADGTLETLGRVDRQVKIRGFRVEPAEIETTLRGFPDVTEAAVVARPGPDRNLALHAYVVGTADPATVKARLVDALPPFLVPSTVTVMESLPYTVGGKLDTSRLPDPLPGSTPTPPRRGRDLSEEVAEIWLDVLGIDHADPDAGFFELGGHSLLAIRMMSRLAERLGVELALTTLFEHPTLRDLTAAVAATLAGDADPPSPATPIGRSVDDSTFAGNDLEALLDEIESLSDDEAAALLAQLEEEGP